MIDVLFYIGVVLLAMAYIFVAGTWGALLIRWQWFDATLCVEVAPIALAYIAAVVAWPVSVPLCFLIYWLVWLIAWFADWVYNIAKG